MHEMHFFHIHSEDGANEPLLGDAGEAQSAS